MEAKPLDRGLVEGTIRDLDGVVEALSERRAEIDHRLEEVTRRRREWQLHLDRLGQNGETTQRAKKGENKRTIVAFMEANNEANNNAGFTMTEISQRTGLSWSSVRNVLTKDSEKDFEQENDKWYLVNAKRPSDPI